MNALVEKILEFSTSEADKMEAEDVIDLGPEMTPTPTSNGDTYTGNGDNTTGYSQVSSMRGLVSNTEPTRNNNQSSSCCN